MRKGKVKDDFFFDDCPVCQFMKLESKKNSLETVRIDKDTFATKIKDPEFLRKLVQVINAANEENKLIH